MKPASSLIVILLIVAFVVPFSVNTSSVQGAGPTEVGGILWDNTTWTAANSPYIITSSVQIPANVTLTIEAGVTVTASVKPSGSYMFLLNGQIIANGNPNDFIVFNAK